jgi:hypothetical protein
MVTRRGGNKLSLGGRFYWTNSKWQATISDAKLSELNLDGYNRANDIKDFGFNAGGPIVKDKAWWWLSYGIQQVKTINAVNVADDTYLNNYGGKLNFQIIPSNRAEVLYQLNDKIKFGRSSSEFFLPGWRQGSKGYFGAPILKIQDEQMFGNNLFVSARFGTSNGGFGMKPENDLNAEKVAYYDYAGGFFYNSYWWFYSDRPHPYGVAQAQYFDDNLFGASHEMKFGFEVNNNSRTYYGTYEGNGNFYVSHNYNVRTVDWNGDGTRDIVQDAFGFDLARIYVRRFDTGYSDGTKRLAVYFNDTISAKRLNFNIGLRFDWAKDYVNENIYRSLWLSGQEPTYPLYSNYAAIADEFFGGDQTVNAIADLLPDTTTPYVVPPDTFWFFSPRLGVTYDLFGTGKTVLKFAYSLYPGGGLGTGYNMPFGQYGRVNFWWADGYGYGTNIDGDNPDGVATWDELYWAAYAGPRPAYHAFNTSGVFVGDVDREYGYMYSDCILGETDLEDSHQSVDRENWKTDLTHELNLSIEHELFRDFGLSLSFNYKRMGRFSWTVDYYPALSHVRSKDDYIIAGTVPATLTNGLGQTFDPGEAAGKHWYVLTGADEGLYTDYSRTVMQDPKRHNTYWGLDFVWTKRFSHKWMASGSFTYQDQRSYFGDYGYLDPTNLWASEGQIYAFDMGGGSGKTTRPFFTRWMFKLQGLYQLPYDISVSGTVSGHQGTYYQTYFSFEDDTLPNPDSISNDMPTTKYNDRTKLGDVWVFNFKLEKMFKLGEAGKMYFSADVFNAINANTILRKRDIHYGTFYFQSNVFDDWAEPNANSGFNNEVLNPLLVRLGLRFQF